MNSPRPLLILLLGSCLTTLLQAQTISIAPERASGLYQPGETIRWQVTVTDPGSLQSPTYVIKTGGLTDATTGKLVLSEGKATISTKSDKPDWLLLEVSGKNASNTSIKAQGGALVAPESITPAGARPADFDAFWQAKLDELAAVPINAVLTTGSSGRSGVDYATVTLDCIRGTHVQGQLARPTSGEKFPALLIVQWAGVYSLQKSWVTDRAAEGWLALNTQAHDITPVESDAFYQALNNGSLSGYWRIGNEDRDTSYFLRMYVACRRAVDYLSSRPDWDGKTLVVTGASQGGLQALVTAALSPKVTAVIADVPAGSDQGGLEAGRVPGWPQWAWQAWDRDLAKVKEASRYYDVTNFAPRIHCPVLIGVGLIDTVVPPPGVYATFNLLDGAKEIVPMALADHQNKHDAYGARNYAWLTAIRAGTPPVLRIAPASAQVRKGARTALSVVAQNKLPLGYQWLKNGAPIPGATADTLVLPSTSAGDAAEYSVVVTSPAGSVTSTKATLSVLDEQEPTAGPRLSNLSSRSHVGTGNDLMIAGFVITGSGSKQVLIRGVGPTLGAFGVDGALADPQLTLTNQKGEEILFNDNWNDSPSATSIRSLSASAGAFALPEGGKDAALLVTLPPGGYTALMRGVSNGTGIGLVEVYDLDTGSSARLSNLSSRAAVAAGTQLIAGYVVSGQGDKQLLTRAMGPALSEFNLSPLLPRPRLRLINQQSVELFRNEGWENASSPATLASMSDLVGASPKLKTGSRDSAILSLQPAAPCSAVMDDASGAGGIAMVELYETP